MPRKKTILQSEFPYHLTARCVDKQSYPIPIEKVWEIYSMQLTFINWAYEAKIHSFVLMNNHFHLLLSTPSSNLSEIMNYFMRTTALMINSESNRINQLYGGPYFWSLMKSHHYFLHAYKYVYRNPVQANLVERCEEYEFSSLSFLLGKTRATFPVVEDLTLFSDIEGVLSWVNIRPEKYDLESVRRALKRREFKFAKNSRGMPNRLEARRL